MSAGNRRTKTVWERVYERTRSLNRTLHYGWWETLSDDQFSAVEYELAELRRHLAEFDEATKKRETLRKLEGNQSGRTPAEQETARRLAKKIRGKP